MFRVYAAVDIRDGKCVRLYQGDPGRETVFAENPLHMATRWESKGASYIHVVDLDGAAEGTPVNLKSVRDILDGVGIPVQVGGGIRIKEHIAKLLSMGADRVILSTGALMDAGFLEESILAYGSKVIVSIDTREGRMAVKGWTQTIDGNLDDTINRLKDLGCKRIIHTDITRDGTLRGYDIGAIEPLLDRGLGVIAAGGISRISDLQALKALVHRGVEGAIVGRALYSGEIALEELIYLEEE